MSLSEPKTTGVIRTPDGKFAPGGIGNPNGRPLGSLSLTDKLRQYLTQHPEEATKIIEALANQGKLGNIIATKEMFDRIDGRVIERHKIDMEMPVTIRFVPANQVIGQAADWDALETQQDETPGVIEGEVRELLPMETGEG